MHFAAVDVVLIRSTYSCVCVGEQAGALFVSAEGVCDGL